MTARTIAIILMFAAASPLFADDDERLIGSWRFEEGEGLAIEEASGKGPAARILNDGRGVKWVQGRRGKAVEFIGGDGDNRNVAGCVGIGGLDEVDWSNGLTIELWIRFTRIDRPKTYEIVSNTISDNGKGFRFRLSWLKLELMSGEGGQGKTWGAGSQPSKLEFKTDQWYHLAATYGASKFRVYIDGELAGESDQLELTPGDKTVYVGAYRGGYAYGLNAVVDDLKLYNAARSAAQIVMAAKLGD